MNIKEYLSQAYHIDKRINSKIEQARSLHELATKASFTISDMPKSSTRNFKQMENNIAKMVDLVSEINDDIKDLLNLKQDILSIIKNISNPEHQIILELRYLNFQTWDQIADVLKYNVRYVYKLHDKALITCNSIFKKLDTKKAQNALEDTINI